MTESRPPYVTENEITPDEMRAVCNAARVLTDYQLFVIETYLQQVMAADYGEVILVVKRGRLRYIIPAPRIQIDKEAKEA